MNAPDVKKLSMRLKTLEKRNKKWATLLKLLAGGAVAAATIYYRAAIGGAMPTELLKFAKETAPVVKNTVSGAGKSLYSQAQLLSGQILGYSKAAYGQAKRILGHKNQDMSTWVNAPGISTWANEHATFSKLRNFRTY
jgi:hypothetical protein